MSADWYSRFVEVIETDERSPRAISLLAGLGPNYIQQTIKDGKKPGIENLISVLSELGSGAVLYVIAGIRMTTEDEEVLRLVLSLDAGGKAAARGVLERMQSPEDSSVHRHADLEEVSAKDRTD